MTLLANINFVTKSPISGLYKVTKKGIFYFNNITKHWVESTFDEKHISALNMSKLTKAQAELYYPGSITFYDKQRKTGNGNSKTIV